MRALLALAFAALLLAPAAAAGPAGVRDPAGGLVLRTDEDGMTSLLLLVEDSPGGVVTNTRVALPQTSPHVREVGVYTRVYDGFEGAPSVSAGIYVVGDAAMLRVPLVIVENAASTADASNDLLETLSFALQAGALAPPYLEEILLPELSAHFGEAPGTGAFTRYQDHPTLYVWTVHRAVPGAEIWSGAYLARTGSYETRADGTVATARADAELGVATRAAADTIRMAAAFLESAWAGERGDQTTRYTAGAVAAGVRAPLTSVELRDTRSGGDLAIIPADQRTRASLGVHADGRFVPLLGVETTQTARPSQGGQDLERISNVGAYTPEGAYVPLAGLRYHSDTGTLLDALLAFVADGPGSPDAGNFEVDVGTFVEGEYAPAAGLVHRERFREMHYAYASMVGVGVYTPVGFSPAGVVTYDGSLPLIPWTFALLRGEADGMQWMIAAGTMAAGSYVPLVGVGTVGAAPAQERDEGFEVRAGVFLGSYHAFLPIASLAYDGDGTIVQHANAFVGGGTLGSDAGAFDLRAGTYTPAGYLALAGVGFRSDFDGARQNETLLVAGVYHDGAFIPLVGVLYQSNDHFLGSLNNAGNVRDDDEARLYAGAFVLGEWTPLVMVENSGEGVRVLPLP